MLPQYYLLHADSPLTCVIKVEPPASNHRMLPDGSPSIFVPLSLNSGADSRNSHTDAVRNGDYETDPKPVVYGAQLGQHITREMTGADRLIAEERNNPSEEGKIEIQRRLLRIKSLYDAVWALHMIEIAHDPKVWRLLNYNAYELNLPGTDVMSSLEKALEASVSGDTEKLEGHIKVFIEENLRLGRHSTRPVSELERFMVGVPAGSAVLSRLRMVQRVATENPEESRLLTEDTMYGLWWVLEKKAREFERIARK